MLDPETLSRVVAEAVHSQSSLSGFEEVKPRCWVDGSNAPIRWIVSFSTLKGLRLAPVWGVSLDFVPKLEGTRFILRANNKGAKFDLFCDPLDDRENAVENWSVDRFQDVVEAAAQARKVVGEVLKHAKDFWHRTSTDPDLVVEFERLRTRPTYRFGWSNYPNLSLAYAFVLIRIGRSEQGMEHLNVYKKWLGQHLNGHPSCGAALRQVTEMMRAAAR